MQKGSSLEGFNVLYDGTGNSDATIATKITCHALIDSELVELVQRYGFGTKKDIPLGKLPELWPFDLIKRPLITEAQRFIDQVATQGYIAQTGPYAFRLWGPYMEKVGTPQDWTPEAGNDFISKQAQQRKATRVFGYQGNEFNLSKGCAFLIQGEFTKKGSLGKVDEQTGVVLV